MRLTQGDFEREARYGDPAGAGGPLRRGRAPPGSTSSTSTRRARVCPTSAARCSRIVELASAAGVRVQTGGGIRSEDAAADLLELRGEPGRAGHGRPRGPRPGGALRPALARPGGRGPRLPGGRRRGGRGLGARLEPGFGPGGDRAARALWADEPIGAVVATAVARDGMLEGPDLPGLGRAPGGDGAAASWPPVAWPRWPTWPHWRTWPADGRRLAGAIVGKAIVDGRFSVEEGVAACAASG